jgi:predicted ATPase
VVLEDMQWADHASLFVLREVAGAVSTSAEQPRQAGG